jgi:hypothetical protein
MILYFLLVYKKLTFSTLVKLLIDRKRNRETFHSHGKKNLKINQMKIGSINYCCPESCLKN